MRPGISGIDAHDQNFHPSIPRIIPYPLQTWSKEGFGLEIAFQAF